MSKDLTVIHYGVDSSGRDIWMTAYMTSVFRAALRHSLVAPFASKIVIIQGAFMTRNGGGAPDSSGYHDQGGCLDIRTWNLTTAEISAWVKVTRMLAFAFWRRDFTAAHGGMDPHAHGTLGTDGPLSYGAGVSWNSYLSDGDGLAGPGSDYEWRPNPLVLVPPNDLLEEDPLMSDAALNKLDEILKIAKDTNNDLAMFRTNELDRDKKAAEKARESKKELVSALAGVVDSLIEIANKVDDTATKEQVRKVRQRLLDALAADPDVDGPDNPA